MSDSEPDRLPLALIAGLFRYLSSRDFPKLARSCRRFASASRQLGASPADIAIHSQRVDWVFTDAPEFPSPTVDDTSGVSSSSSSNGGEMKHACRVCSVEHGERMHQEFSNASLGARVVYHSCRDNTVAWRSVARFAAKRVTAHSMCAQTQVDLAGSRLLRTVHSLALVHLRQPRALRVFEALQTLWVGALDTRLGGFEVLPSTLTSLTVNVFHTPSDCRLAVLARACPQLVTLDVGLYGLDHTETSALLEFQRLESLRVLLFYTRDAMQTIGELRTLRQLAFVPHARQCHELAQLCTGAAPRLPNFQRVTVYQADDSGENADAEAVLRQYMPRSVAIHVAGSVHDCVSLLNGQSLGGGSGGGRNNTTAPVAWDHVDYCDSFRAPLPPLPSHPPASENSTL